MSRQFTAQDVAMHNARRAFKKREMMQTGNPANAQPDEGEKRIHGYIMDECDRRGWLYFHGSTAHKTKRTPGEPDFVILAEPFGGHPNNPPRVYFVECKKPGGKPSEDQRNVIAHARKLGHTIHVVTSFSDFLAIL